jgi:hypothetical protein
MWFVEPVTPGAGEIVFFPEGSTPEGMISGELPIRIKANDSSQVAFQTYYENINNAYVEERTRMIVTPLSSFDESGVKYRIEVDENAVVDSSGNKFAGFSGTTYWFHIADRKRPRLLNTEPKHSSMNVQLKEWAN